ncbi:DUF423 domain-containing protein [Thalassotalea psychrophila]|uniref:DUF423 domain-containing protein n=1 Tax=Thalassotalea psychrophila TaxID=3065647 RepID=A0ABY9TZB9_9GAMM|nr:DUF423 domain-containing protein [Colwelliaceae bacterium SQ149]
MSILSTFSGIIAAACVLMAAWLSHSGDKLSLQQVSNLETALLFAFIHSIAIFIAVLLFNQTKHKLCQYAACLFGFGLLSFCGLIILKTFLPIGMLSKLTPMGGIAFALGWIVLGFAGSKCRTSS